MMHETPRGVRHYNIGAHLFGSRGLGGSGVGAGVTTWGQVVGGGLKPKPLAPMAPPPTRGTTDLPSGARPRSPLIPSSPLDAGPGGTIRKRFPLLPRNPFPETPKEEPKKEEPKKERDDFETLADAFSRALSMQPVSTQDATPTVIMDPNSGSDSGMNIKGILILLGVAALAWFAWKKWGSKAVASAAA